MNIEFLTILLEEMERVDLLEELLAWVQDKDDTARAAQKRGQRVGIAGPSDEESTFITVSQRMRDRIMDPGTLVRGCEELVNLMGDIRAQVAECSISIILAAMRHHIMSEPVQEAGCVTLANVCYHHRGLHALIVMQVITLSFCLYSIFMYVGGFIMGSIYLGIWKNRNNHNEAMFSILCIIITFFREV